jgi:hypothetical protein
MSMSETLDCSFHPICVAALTEEDQIRVLEFMDRNFDADTTPAEQLDLNALS